MNTLGESTAIELDELVVTVIVDNETDNLSSVDAGIPKLPEVVSLLGRIAPTRRHRGHDRTPVFHELCVACHGLSVLLDGRRGDVRHSHPTVRSASGAAPASNAVVRPSSTSPD